MAVTSSIWEKVAQRTVTSAMATVPVVSRLHCVLRCQQMGGCGSAAFDSASGVCYLQPTHRRFAEGDAGQPVDVVTIESASECKVSEAPYVPNAHVSWRPMSSALEGDVSCDEDYMLSADVTAQLSCEPETGIWARDMPAFCAKFAWSHSTAQTGVLYPVPRPVHGGWCLQLNGSSSGTRCDGDRTQETGARIQRPEHRRTFRGHHCTVNTSDGGLRLLGIAIDNQR
ncbi:uncharacterized protein LOC143298591 [Babylonia areolata]|uniref:uncharacterized protein LOC143298591 n=1 Tax=Babylonia areolata TaxID=304850 RepID=UPI003FD59777